MVKRYGPYRTSGGHWFWVDTYPGGRKSVLVHREVVEKHLGRQLKPGEVVHHVDGNPSNNDLANLEVKSRAEHTRGHARPPELVVVACAWCGALIEKLARQVKQNQARRGCTGPFCNKSCAGKKFRANQLAAGRVNLRKREAMQT